MRLAVEPLAQCLGETGLPDARLPAEQNHLSFAAARQLPAMEQQRHSSSRPTSGASFSPPWAALKRPSVRAHLVHAP